METNQEPPDRGRQEQKDEVKQMHVRFETNIAKATEKATKKATGKVARASQTSKANEKAAKPKHQHITILQGIEGCERHQSAVNPHGENKNEKCNSQKSESVRLFEKLLEDAKDCPGNQLEQILAECEREEELQSIAALLKTDV